jgi:hypothetical protein
VQQHHPITTPPGPRRAGLEPPGPNPFLVPGWWQIACVSCAHVLWEGRSQDRFESSPPPALAELH